MLTKSFPGVEGTLVHRRRLVLLWLLGALVLGGTWVAPAQAQMMDDCPADQPDGCCDPRQSVDENQEEGINADCPPAAADAPGGRRHRRGGDGPDGAQVDDNHTGAGDEDADDGGSFGSGGNLRRGSGNRRPADGDALLDGTAGPGASGPGDSGGAPGGAIGGGPVSASPGEGAPSETRAGSGAVSRPGTGSPAAGPSVGGSSGGSGAGAGARSAAGGRSGAGARSGAGTTTAGGSIARTGPDVDIPLGLAVTLLAAGVSLRRAARPRTQPAERRRPAASRRRRPTGPPAPAAAPPDWSYVDHSSSARAIEKF